MTLEDDIAELLKEKSRSMGMPFKRVVNEALRRGLEGGGVKPQRPVFSIEPNQSGFVQGIDSHKLNQLADELEATDFIEASGK